MTTTRERLASFSCLFNVLSSVYYEDFSAETLCRLLRDEVEVSACGEDIAEAYGKLVEESRVSDEASVDAIAADYVSAFAGFNRSCAFPYESVYRSEEMLLMQVSCDEVSSAYRDAGYVAPPTGNEPPDHLGAELGFIAHLCDGASSAFAEGDGERAGELLRKQEAFYREHIAEWVPSFCADAKTKVGSGYYAAAVALTEAGLQKYADFVSEAATSHSNLEV